MTRLLSKRALLAAGAIALLAGVGSAWALPQRLGSVSLLTGAQGRLDGPPGSQAGWAIANLGPLGGHHGDAVAIGMPGADAEGRAGAGAVAVLFGRRRMPTVLDLSGLNGRDGILIAGAGAGDAAGFTVAAVRRRHHHTLLAVGAPHATALGRAGAGAVYLVDPARAPRVVDLAHPGRGVVMVAAGPSPGAEAGYALAAGELARGGGGDLVVGAPAAGDAHAARRGMVFAVMASQRRAQVDLAGAAGVARLLGAAADDGLGTAVAIVGRRGGPGRLLAGAPYASPGGRAAAGSVFAIDGLAASQTVDLAKQTAVGRLDGDAPNDQAGTSLAALPPIGARGASAAIGSGGASPFGRRAAGQVALVGVDKLSGAASLAGASTARISGAHAGDAAGSVVAAVADPATGRPSLAVGAPFAAGVDAEGVGAAYVLRGPPAWAQDLGALASVGLTIAGARANDQAGTALASADLAGDGRQDLLIGAPYALTASGSVGGAVYVMRGPRPHARAHRPRVHG